MTNANQITYKQNDSGFKIQAVLSMRSPDGTLTAVALAGGDTVKWLFREEDSLTSKVEATATKEATTGLVSYTWVAGDLNTPGVYRGEWEVTFASGKVQTFPSDGYHQITVLKDLGVGA